MHRNYDWEYDEARSLRLFKSRTGKIVIVLSFCLSLVDQFGGIPHQLNSITAEVISLGAFIISLGFRSWLPKVGTGTLAILGAVQIFNQFSVSARLPLDRFFMVLGLPGILLLVFWAYKIIRLRNQRLEELIQNAASQSEVRNDRPSTS